MIKSPLRLWKPPQVATLSGGFLFTQCIADYTESQQIYAGNFDDNRNLLNEHQVIHMPYYFKSKLKPLIYKKHKQLSHETISILSGVNRPTITRWMGDRLLRRLDMDILEPIARWLECDPSDLYEIVEVEEP